MIISNQKLFGFNIKYKINNNNEDKTKTIPNRFVLEKLGGRFFSNLPIWYFLKMLSSTQVSSIQFKFYNYIIHRK